MSIKTIALSVVSLCLVLLGSCAVKIGGASRTGAPPPAVAESPREAPRGTLEVSPEIQRETRPHGQVVTFSWDYVNDTEETLRRPLEWLCRVYDDEGFIASTKRIGILPVHYAYLEPGAKLRGRETVVVADSVRVASVDCLPVEP